MWFSESCCQRCVFGAISRTAAEAPGLKLAACSIFSQFSRNHWIVSSSPSSKLVLGSYPIRSFAAVYGGQPPAVDVPLPTGYIPDTCTVAGGFINHIR